MDREAMRLRDGVAVEYATLVYRGFWFSPEREALQKMIDAINEPVTGVARLRLYKGSSTLIGRTSPASLYRNDIVTFEDDRGAYDQRDATGFIRLNALRLRTSAWLKTRLTPPIGSGMGEKTAAVPSGDGRPGVQGKPEVMIVDDEPITARGYARALTAAGYNVTIAAAGREGATMARSKALRRDRQRHRDARHGRAGVAARHPADRSRRADDLHDRQPGAGDGAGGDRVRRVRYLLKPGPLDRLLEIVHRAVAVHKLARSGAR
jgi:hypothetical protein